MVSPNDYHKLIKSMMLHYKPVYFLWFMIQTYGLCLWFLHWFPMLLRRPCSQTIGDSQLLLSIHSPPLSNYSRLLTIYSQTTKLIQSARAAKCVCVMLRSCLASASPERRGRGFAERRVSGEAARRSR